MKLKAFVLAVASVLCAASVAHAATTDPLFGTYKVRVVNFDADGDRPGDSVADDFNFDYQFQHAEEGRSAEFVYRGKLDFHIDNKPRDLDRESILDFLLTGGNGSGDGRPGGGEVFGLDEEVGNLRLSLPLFQITTLFEFTAIFDDPFRTHVTHDDGFTLYDDGDLLLGYANPTGIRTTYDSEGERPLFDGGNFKLVYASANGNPSRLLVTGGAEARIATAPLPASALLLLGAVGLLGGLRVLRRAAA